MSNPAAPAPVPGTAASVGLLLCRLIAGGLFVFAGGIKLMNPKMFALDIQSLRILPPGMADTIAPGLAYFVPWLEITVGVALVLGFWAREAALLLSLMVTSFTIALTSVILRGMNVSCGCFGDALDGLFGGSGVGWHSVIRNGVFLAMFLAVLWKGPGRFSMDLWRRGASPAPDPSAPATPVEAS